MTPEPENPPDQLKHRDKTSYHEGHTSPERADTARLRVILPEDPPHLTPQAARALLRILRKAYARRTHSDPHASDQAPRPPQEDRDG